MKSLLFTEYTDGFSSYEFYSSSSSSTLAEYASDSENPYFQTELDSYSPPKKSFIPCPSFSGKNTVFTFRFSSFSGTNTRGGIETTYYEVNCLSCGIFSVF